jgi:hypothetical protein
VDVRGECEGAREVYELFWLINLHLRLRVSSGCAARCRNNCPSRLRMDDRVMVIATHCDDESISLYRINRHYMA